LSAGADPGVVCWCIPLNLTENSLHAGSVLARRIPQVLARMLSDSGAVQADWAPLVVDVEEGLGYVVTVATADETESREHLADLAGDYLLFGQIDFAEPGVWLDARLFSRRRDEVQLYPGYSGSRIGFLQWLPEWAREVAETIRGPLPPEVLQRLIPPTESWSAFRSLCHALDDYGREVRDPQWETRVLGHVYAALEADPALEWAAEVGARIATGCLAAGELEHAADLAEELARRAAASPTVDALHEAVRRRFGG